jgi:quercetin dioxygenase-like cupin family protein
MTMTTTTNEKGAGAATDRAVTVRGPGEGEAIWFLDNFITVKASAREGARFGLVENALPASSHTPLHRHHDDDESFYILEGTMRLFLEGGRVVDATPGAFVHIPAGVAHGFRAMTALRMLVLSDPAGFVEFVRDYGIEAPRRELPPETPPDVARLGAIAQKHRIEILGPLPE